MSKLVTIGTWPDSTSAEMVVGILKSDGIQAFTHGGYSSSLNMPGVNTFQPVLVQVMEEDLDRAMTILEGYSDDEEPDELRLEINLPSDNTTSEAEPDIGELPVELALDAPTEGNLPRCPKCGSEMLYPRETPALLWLLAALALFIPFLTWREPMECRDCGELIPRKCPLI